jgi:hypothetical protein
VTKLFVVKFPNAKTADLSETQTLIKLMKGEKQQIPAGKLQCVFSA